MRSRRHLAQISQSSERQLVREFGPLRSGSAVSGRMASRATLGPAPGACSACSSSGLRQESLSFGCSSLLSQSMPDYPGKISALPLPKLDRRQLSLTVSELSNDNLRQSLDFRIATSGLASRPGSTPGVSRLCIFQENPADAFRFRVGTEILDTLQDLDPPDDARIYGHKSTSGVLGLVTGKPLSAKPLLKWRRVLLKVSGEALAGDGTENIDSKITMSIAREVASITRLGVEVAIVVGGGNFFRGASWVGSSGLDRASADHIGMMATVMNAIFLQSSLESLGVPTRVQTAFRMAEVAEPYIRRRAIRHLEKGRVVIFGAGTGNPFFTTDTAAALRAAEISAEVVLKATNVDGVYDCDPRKNADAKLLSHVSYREVALKNLSVMDITAITLCQENCIPVVVFNVGETGNIVKALSGNRIGTLIDNEGRGCAEA